MSPWAGEMIRTAVFRVKLVKNVFIVSHIYKWLCAERVAHFHNSAGRRLSGFSTLHWETERSLGTRLKSSSSDWKKVINIMRWFTHSLTHPGQSKVREERSDWGSQSKHHQVLLSSRLVIALNREIVFVFFSLDTYTYNIHLYTNSNHIYNIHIPRCPRQAPTPR